jgi:hypothetical protein
MTNDFVKLETFHVTEPDVSVAVFPLGDKMYKVTDNCNVMGAQMSACNDPSKIFHYKDRKILRS